jgi:Galactocerebrosidase, C-terminal lectin domain
MKTATSILFLLLWAVPVFVETTLAAQISIDFDSSDIGKLPADFSTALTGSGGPMAWVVKEDASAPSDGKVLAQTSTDTADYRFPLCVYDKVTAKDVEIAVRFKAVSGKVDQAAGLVARYQDKDNYYIVRANALEDNVRLYTVEGGKRKQFAGKSVKVSSGEWHTLKLAVRETHLIVFFDDQQLFEADNDTFTKPGKVGLWTKADSVTYFDNLTIERHDAGETQ